MNHTTANDTALVEVVLALDHILHSVARWMYQISPRSMASKIKACTSGRSVSAHGPEFLSMGTKMFKPFSTHAPENRAHPANISITSFTAPSCVNTPANVVKAFTFAHSGIKGSSSLPPALLAAMSIDFCVRSPTPCGSGACSG